MRLKASKVTTSMVKSCYFAQEPLVIVIARQQCFEWFVLTRDFSKLDNLRVMFLPS